MSSFGGCVTQFIQDEFLKNVTFNGILGTGREPDFLTQFELGESDYPGSQAELWVSTI